MSRRSTTKGDFSRLALPRAGLLLFLLACGSFILPKIRSIQQPASTVITTEADAMNDLDEDENIAALEQTELNSSEFRTENDSNGIDEELIEWLSLVRDNTLELHKREMPAYWRLLAMTKAESYSSMMDRARKNSVFNDFYLSAPKHRGELVSMVLNIRRVQKYAAREGNPAQLEQLYEVWGWTEQAKTWIYVFVTPELPPGLVEGDLVNQRANFAGYFFKLQAYHSAKPQPNDKPLVAPLLIGKFEVIQRSLPTTATFDIWRAVLFLGLLAFCVISGFAYWHYFHPSNHRRNIAEASGAELTGESTKFDWIDDQISGSKERSKDDGPSAM